MIRFGPAGISESFARQGYKNSKQVPEYLGKMGLNAFEYQCGRGVRVSETSARELRAEADQRDIRLSVHAPYYISMSSVEEDKRLSSVDYILQSARAVDWMGGNRIVVHTGSCGKMGREEALELAKSTMGLALQALDEAGLSHVHICPEVMGKINQLGTLEEVLELCRLDERLIPCIDFGHLNARTFGSLKGYGDFAAVLDAVENALGNTRMRRFHAHFSKIEYTEKGGEKRHLTFEDREYGPDYRPLMQLLAERDCCPVIICESAGTQAEDALTMKREFEQIRGDTA